MSLPASSVRTPAFANLKAAVQTAFFVFIAYWVSAETAFLIGTLSDNIFAPFWPPNVVLLGAMLLAPRDRIWICVAAAFPAHVIAEMRIGMAPVPLLVAFATNVAVAFASTTVIRQLLRKPPWFGTPRKAALYVAFVGFVCPAIVAVGGAFVPILSGSSDGYLALWVQWLAANTLGNLTLGPIVLILVAEGVKAFWPDTRARQVEAVLLISALVVVANIAFRVSAGATNAFLPSVLYAPLPLIIWAATRFGVVGASASILTVTVALIGRALDGPSPFAGADSEANVFALQVFLVCLAVPVLLLGASIDQTRHIELELREDEERIALVAATVNLGFWHRGSGVQVFWLSTQCRKLLGLPDHLDVSPHTILGIVHPEDVSFATEALFGEAPTTSATEFRVTLPDGQISWILCRSKTRQTDGNGLNETSGVFVDITARKAAEVESEQQRRELAHLMRVSQVGELSGGLAHELTQPLTAILANAQAARVMIGSALPDLSLISEVIDDIIDEDHRAGEVIRRLRTLLKDGESKIEEISLNGLVNSTSHLLRNELISRRVKIDRDLDPSLPPVIGDSVQLQQTFINLVMNAIEAVHQMATVQRVITIKTRKGADNTAEVCVIDRGVGISASDQMRIFEPFFTTKERGLGLGLSICSTIIERHQGTLALENNPDGGATATVRLPLERRGDA